MYESLAENVKIAQKSFDAENIGSGVSGPTDGSSPDIPGGGGGGDRGSAGSMTTLAEALYRSGGGGGPAAGHGTTAGSYSQSQYQHAGSGGHILR